MPLKKSQIAFQAFIIAFLKFSFVFHKYTIAPTTAPITATTIPTGVAKKAKAEPNNFIAVLPAVKIFPIFFSC